MAIVLDAFPLTSILPNNIPTAKVSETKSRHEDGDYGLVPTTSPTSYTSAPKTGPGDEIKITDTRYLSLQAAALGLTISNSTSFSKLSAKPGASIFHCTSIEDAEQTAQNLAIKENSDVLILKKDNDFYLVQMNEVNQLKSAPSSWSIERDTTTKPANDKEFTPICLIYGPNKKTIGGALSSRDLDPEIAIVGLPPLDIAARLVGNNTKEQQLLNWSHYVRRAFILLKDLPSRDLHLVAPLFIEKEPSDNLKSNTRVPLETLTNIKTRLLHKIADTKQADTKSILNDLLIVTDYLIRNCADNVPGIQPGWDQNIVIQKYAEKLGRTTQTSIDIAHNPEIKVPAPGENILKEHDKNLIAYSYSYPYQETNFLDAKQAAILLAQIRGQDALIFQRKDDPNFYVIACSPFDTVDAQLPELAPPLKAYQIFKSTDNSTEDTGPVSYSGSSTAFKKATEQYVDAVKRLNLDQKIKEEFLKHLTRQKLNELMDKLNDYGQKLLAKINDSQQDQQTKQNTISEFMTVHTLVHFIEQGQMWFDLNPTQSEMTMQDFVQLGFPQLTSLLNVYAYANLDKDLIQTSIRFDPVFKDEIIKTLTLSEKDPLNQDKDNWGVIPKLIAETKKSVQEESSDAATNILSLLGLLKVYIDYNTSNNNTTNVPLFLQLKTACENVFSFAEKLNVPLKNELYLESFFAAHPQRWLEVSQNLRNSAVQIRTLQNREIKALTTKLSEDKQSEAKIQAETQKIIESYQVILSPLDKAISQLQDPIRYGRARVLLQLEFNLNHLPHLDDKLDSVFESLIQTLAQARTIQVKSISPQAQKLVDMCPKYLDALRFILDVNLRVFQSDPPMMGVTDVFSNRWDSEHALLGYIGLITAFWTVYNELKIGELTPKDFSKKNWDQVTFDDVIELANKRARSETNYEVISQAVPFMLSDIFLNKPFVVVSMTADGKSNTTVLTAENFATVFPRKVFERSAWGQRYDDAKDSSDASRYTRAFATDESTLAALEISKKIALSTEKNAGAAAFVELAKLFGDGKIYPKNRSQTLFLLTQATGILPFDFYPGTANTIEDIRRMMDSGQIDGAIERDGKLIPYKIKDTDIMVREILDKVQHDIELRDRIGPALADKIKNMLLQDGDKIIDWHRNIQNDQIWRMVVNSAVDVAIASLTGRALGIAALKAVRLIRPVGVFTTAGSTIMFLGDSLGFTTIMAALTGQTPTPKSYAHDMVMFGLLRVANKLAVKPVEEIVQSKRFSQLSEQQQKMWIQILVGTASIGSGTLGLSLWDMAKHKDKKVNSVFLNNLLMTSWIFLIQKAGGVAFPDVMNPYYIAKDKAKAFVDAVSNLEKTLNNPKATQTEIDQAIDQYNKAIEDIQSEFGGKDKNVQKNVLSLLENVLSKAEYKNVISALEGLTQIKEAENKPETNVTDEVRDSDSSDDIPFVTGQEIIPNRRLGNGIYYLADNEFHKLQRGSSSQTEKTYSKQVTITTRKTPTKSAETKRFTIKGENEHALVLQEEGGSLVLVFFYRGDQSIIREKPKPFEILRDSARDRDDFYYLDDDLNIYTVTSTSMISINGTPSGFTSYLVHEGISTAMLQNKSIDIHEIHANFEPLDPVAMVNYYNTHARNLRSQPISLGNGFVSFGGRIYGAGSCWSFPTLNFSTDFQIGYAVQTDGSVRYVLKTIYPNTDTQYQPIDPNFSGISNTSDTKTEVRFLNSRAIYVQSDTKAPDTPSSLFDAEGNFIGLGTLNAQGQIELLSDLQSYLEHPANKNGQFKGIAAQEKIGDPFGNGLLVQTDGGEAQIWPITKRPGVGNYRKNEYFVAYDPNGKLRVLIPSKDQQSYVLARPVKTEPYSVQMNNKVFTLYVSPRGEAIVDVLPGQNVAALGSSGASILTRTFSEKIIVGFDGKDESIYTFNTVTGEFAPYTSKQANTYIAYNPNTGFITRILHQTQADGHFERFAIVHQPIFPKMGMLTPVQENKMETDAIYKQVWNAVTTYTKKESIYEPKVSNDLVPIGSDYPYLIDLTNERNTLMQNFINFILKNAEGGPYTITQFTSPQSPKDASILYDAQKYLKKLVMQGDIPLEGLNMTFNEFITNVLGIRRDAPGALYIANPIADGELGPTVRLSLASYTHKISGHPNLSPERSLFFMKTKEGGLLPLDQNTAKIWVQNAIVQYEKAISAQKHESNLLKAQKNLPMLQVSIHTETKQNGTLKYRIQITDPRTNEIIQIPIVTKVWPSGIPQPTLKRTIERSLKNGIPFQFWKNLGKIEFEESSEFLASIAKLPDGKNHLTYYYRKLLLSDVELLTKITLHEKAHALEGSDLQALESLAVAAYAEGWAPNLYALSNGRELLPGIQDYPGLSKYLANLEIMGPNALYDNTPLLAKLLWVLTKQDGQVDRTKFAQAWENSIQPYLMTVIALLATTSMYPNDRDGDH